MDHSARGDHEGEPIDPRRQRSRDRLLDAATQLLISGGVQAVTVEAVTNVSKVARTTLYRNFGNSAGLIAAAFERLLPQIEPPDPGASVRRQLIDLLLRQAAVIDQVPVHVTTLAWLGLGSTGDRDPSARFIAPDSLRARVIERYREPFDRVLDSPAARTELGDFDRTLGLAQLLGPIVFLRLVELRPTTQADCARIVDDFLATHRAPEGGTA